MEDMWAWRVQGKFVCKWSWGKWLEGGLQIPKALCHSGCPGEQGQRSLPGPLDFRDFQQIEGSARRPSLCELRAQALSGECVGRGDWCGVGEQEKQKDDTYRLLPWFLCRAGAWALSSRSTACTLRWRSNSTSGQQEWGSFEARSFGAQAPAFTSLPPPLSMKMSLAPSVRLKRCPKVITLELAANIWARAGI